MFMRLCRTASQLTITQPRKCFTGMSDVPEPCEQASIAVAVTILYCLEEKNMKKKLLTFAALSAILGVLGHFYAKPLMAQVRAALVSDVDNPARGFVQMAFRVAGGGTVSVVGDPQFTVPLGKRLVIDTVSAVSSDLGQHQATGGLWLLAGAAGSCRINTLVFPFSNPIAIVPLTYTGQDVFGNFRYAGIARLQSYLDSGQCLAITIDHDSVIPLTAGYEITVSGHLVSLP
jgi:hypothetical protein